MLLQTRCLNRITRATCPHTKWPQVHLHTFSSSAPDVPPWFKEIRNEMLNRELPTLRDHLDEATEVKLANTLCSFFPNKWRLAARNSNPIVPVGNHLTRFNAQAPSDQLLPDGTDTLHSPGEPFDLRMWAGGSIRINLEQYFDTGKGFSLGSEVVCTERIRDVQLRGKNDDAKIFVTIERQFTREYCVSNADETGNVEPPLVEERNLVFLKQKTEPELQAIKEGQMLPTRYLQPPSKDPEFSHTLIPTRTLLFRYSALTFNAHAIHLDKAYSREVEGHRNLLVHGPLSLTFMLQFISAHLRSLPGNPQVVESVQYRNLAPLYCDEELRLCGSGKKASGFGSIYDVWIEGPTGGMAVKATVNTRPFPSPTT